MSDQSLGPDLVSGKRWKVVPATTDAAATSAPNHLSTGPGEASTSPWSILAGVAGALFIVLVLAIGVLVFVTMSGKNASSKFSSISAQIQ